MFQEIDNSGSLSNNTVDGSNEPQHWSLLVIKQEKEEEEEQSVSQRGDLLEENQNPEQHTNNPVKEEEADSSSATTDKQVSVHDFMMVKDQCFPWNFFRPSGSHQKIPNARAERHIGAVRWRSKQSAIYICIQIFAHLILYIQDHKERMT